MSLEEIKKSLEAVENGGSIYENVLKVVQAEKDLAIESTKKVKEELKGMSKWKDFANNVGYDGSDDLDTFTEKVKSKMASADNKSDIETRFTSLEARFNAEVKKREDAESKLSEVKAKRTRDVMKTAIVNAFKDEKGDSKVYAPDLLANELINNGSVKLLDDDKTIIFKDGESNVDFDTGIGNVLEKRKDLVKNTQKPGGGSSTPKQSKFGISNQEFNNMTPRDQALYVKEHGADSVQKEG